jgi:hypothetical protein
MAQVEAFEAQATDRGEVADNELDWEGRGNRGETPFDAARWRAARCLNLLRLDLLRE